MLGRTLFITLGATIGAVLSTSLFAWDTGEYRFADRWVLSTFACVMTGVIVSLLGLWRADAREDRLWGPKAQWRDEHERKGSGWRV